MTLFEIVALYAAIFLIMNIVLMYRVGQVRINKKIDLGDGGDALMLSRVRAHGNFSETVPLALIGLVALAMLSAPVWMLHMIGGAMVIGRLSHAMGMSGTFKQGRLVGTLLFMLTSIFMAGFIIYKIVT